MPHLDPTQLAEFFAAPATVVAPRLLGAFLTVDEVTVRLTEVEAYRGQVDPASHGYRGPTARNGVMFGEPGHLYAYFTYGMHTCANLVCEAPGSAGAVLLRAGEVVVGADVARSRRLTSRVDADLARGPARLCVALGITLADNGAALAGGRFALELPRTPATDVATSPRTGVSGPGGTAEYPWRYWLPGEPSVSPYRRSTR